ncbi:MAG: serine/threonine protein kinase [Acidobacteria bacterium]|nr:serine/threonine protein kinase [Acidobacteriota bacterium]
MTPELWQHIEAMFQDLLALPPAERPTALEEAAAGDPEARRLLEELLAAHEATSGPLDRPVVRWEGDGPPSPAIGPYRLLQEIGRGGMGRVFLAERSDGSFKRRVAVKLLHPGLASELILERFRRERQILAHLAHPNIAGLLDGGSTAEGQPFLVMEYVEGVPLDEHCRRHRPSLEDRLRLFLEICSAVSAAHRNLVVHRDLKPGNVLVTERGKPKLLDFGIAKLLEEGSLPGEALATETGQMPLTPEYASPEQVRGEVITTASDVYSLGALLYHLLTGRSPHPPRSRNPLEWMEVVSSVAPPPPSAAVSAEEAGAAPVPDPRELRGDLDQIALMALRKEPERRYPSAERLAADVEAFLDGRPVEARGEDLLYRAGKFVRRHRWAVGAAAAALRGRRAFSAALWLQQRRLIEERDLARSTAGLLQDLFRLPDPYGSGGETITAREILERKARELERPLAGSPPVRASLRRTLGSTYLHLGLYEEAAEQLQRSLELRPAAAGGEGKEALLELAAVRQLQGRLGEAEELARESLAGAQKGRRGTELEGRSLLRLGKVHELAGELDRAEEELARGLEAVRASESAAAREALATGLDDLATLLELRGRSREAVAAYREALAVLEGLHGELHPEVAWSLNNLALALRGEDREASIGLLEKAISILETLYGPSDPQLTASLGNLGLLHAEAHRQEEAEALYRRALTVLGEERAGDPRRASILNNLAELRLDQGRLDEAEELHRQALELRRHRLGEAHRETAVSLTNLGMLLFQAGKLDEAEDLLKRARAASVESFGKGHPRTALALNNLALLAEYRQDLERAHRYASEALDISRRVLGESHPQVAGGCYNLARIRQARGDLPGAEEGYDGAVAAARTYAGDDPTDLGRYLLGSASLQLEQGRPEKAVELSREALARLEPTTGPSDPWLLSGRRILGLGLLDLGRYVEAEPLLRSAHEALSRERGPEDPATLRLRSALVRLEEARDRQEGKPST